MSTAAQRAKLPPPRTLALVLAALGLLAIFPYIPATRSPNELCRLWQTRSLVDFGTVEINDALRRYGPVGDLSRFIDARGVHYYPSKAPLLSYLAVPVYAALKALAGGEGGRVSELGLVYFARLFCTVLPALLVLWPLRRFLEAYFEEGLAAALLLGYALGSISYPYAELFMSHGLTGIELFLVFYALWRHRRGDWGLGAYPLAGLLAGLTVATEYTGALALPALAVYGLYTCRTDRVRAGLLGVLGVLPSAAFLAWYHSRCFGGPLETGYKHLNDAAYQGWHVGGFLGIGLPDARALFLSYFSPLRGLFVVSPFLILALPGLALLARREGARPEQRLFLAQLLLYSYFTAGFSYDSWGWTTGPRHLTPLTAFLLVPAGECLLWLRQRGAAWAGAGAALLALSVVNTGLLTQVNYISDCVRNGVHRLALPLVMSGHLPSSPLSFAGVPTPWAWLPEGLALAGAVALAITGVLLGLARAGQGAAVAAGVTAALFVLHGLIPTGPDTECEEATVRNLGRDFLPQPGQATPGLWRR